MPGGEKPKKKPAPKKPGNPKPVGDEKVAEKSGANKVAQKSGAKRKTAAEARAAKAEAEAKEVEKYEFPEFEQMNVGDRLIVTPEVGSLDAWCLKTGNAKGPLMEYKDIVALYPDTGFWTTRIFVPYAATLVTKGRAVTEDTISKKRAFRPGKTGLHRTERFDSSTIRLSWAPDNKEDDFDFIPKEQATLLAKWVRVNDARE